MERRVLEPLDFIAKASSLERWGEAMMLGAPRLTSESQTGIPGYKYQNEGHRSPALYELRVCPVQGRERSLLLETVLRPDIARS
jgi:hypothetical protein